MENENQEIPINEKEEPQIDDLDQEVYNDNSEKEEPAENSKESKKKAKGFRAFHFTDQIYSAIRNIGYKNPTPIQKKVIPEILSGFNIIAHSRTGSGKTAAFLLPALGKLKEHSKIVGARCLILSPTRELAHQTGMFCRKLGKFTNLRYALLVGGNELESQFEKLAQNPDIIIATPGRVLHHIDEGSLQLKKIEILIIDEADKMMELNFESQLREIIKNCPINKQLIMLSATMQGQLSTFLKSGIIKEYKLINIEEENKIPEKLKIHLIYTRKDEKVYAFVSLFNDKKIINLDKELTIVFTMTKYHCEYLQEFLKYYDINANIIYGQMEQELRNRNLEDFRKGRNKLLIVTDVAARGIDIPLLDNVINFDFPDNQKLFIHRVGRTARAGRKGRVFNLVTVDELPYFFDIKYYLGKKFTLNTENDKENVEDYNIISFGSVPGKVINDIKSKKKDYLFTTKFDIEQLYTTMQKAEKKGILFRLKPSLFGIKSAKNLLSEFDMKFHPFYYDKYADEEKQNFLNELKRYKPKENYFEKIRETTVNDEILNEFKIKSEQYKKKKELEKEKEKLQKQHEMELFEEEEKENFEKEDAENVEEEGKLLNKKVKRSKIKNFKNPNQFISAVQDTTSDKKKLWGGERPLELDEVTLNINTDDTMVQRKKQIWDDKKKTFVNAKVDKTGKIINESGKLVKKNENYHPYKNWKKKSKMSIQSAGEVERESTVRTARERFIERKQNGGNKKGDLKTFQQILKEKKKRFKENQKRSKKFSKRKFKENELQSRTHLNSKSQRFIKRKIKRK